MRVQVHVKDVMTACTRLEAKLEAKNAQVELLLPLKERVKLMETGALCTVVLYCWGCLGCDWTTRPMSPFGAQGGASEQYPPHVP